MSSIHYAIFFAQNANTTATDRTLASKTLALPEPLTRYFSVGGVKGIYGTEADHIGCSEPSHHAFRMRQHLSSVAAPAGTSLRQRGAWRRFPLAFSGLR
ncbi:hypothetical protein GFL15_32265 [Rhizobium leguminosarum bv. viciae]|nr:hypothetical protein [Rhizobium leguminosarum bv. viciae]